MIDLCILCATDMRYLGKQATNHTRRICFECRAKMGFAQVHKLPIRPILAIQVDNPVFYDKLHHRQYQETVSRGI